MESDLERLDELELTGMVEEARRARTSNQTLSQEEVKKRLKKRVTESPERTEK